MRAAPVSRIVAVMDGEIFWSIISWGVLLGLGAIGGFVGYYWFVVLPQRLVPGPAASSSKSAPPTPGQAADRGPAWH
jgi:hypothetical protein